MGTFNSLIPDLTLTPTPLVYAARAPFAALIAGLILATGLLTLVAPAHSESDRSGSSQDAWIGAVQRNKVMELARQLAAQQAAGAVDRRASDGKTALMAAAAAGNAELLVRLIDAGADPAAVNFKGASGLIYGAWSGNTDVLMRLIEQRVPLEQAASNGWTAMTMASAKGRVEAIRLLIRSGSRVDPPDVYGWTPLMRACNLGRLDVARVLITEGKASLTRFNASGQTALHLAAAAGHRELYELLVRLGADPTTADSRGLTPAAIAGTAFDTR